jgi:ribosomal protein S11
MINSKRKFFKKPIEKRKITFTKRMYRKKFFRGLTNLNLNKHCFIYIKHTTNNTFITVKDRKKVILVTSSGSIGFKGPKRPGKYAATELAKHVKQVLLTNKKKKTATVFVLSKITPNVKSAIKNLSYNYGLKIIDIVQRIPVPHNGMRKPHLRRK